MLIGGELFKIELAKGQVGFADGVTVFVHGEDFKQPVRRNNRTVRGGQILGGEQAKGDSGHFAVCADSEQLILFQNLVERNSRFLSLIVETGGSFSNFDFLSCIDKLGGVDFFV